MSTSYSECRRRRQKRKMSKWKIRASDRDLIHNQDYLEDIRDTLIPWSLLLCAYSVERFLYNFLHTSHVTGPDSIDGRSLCGGGDVEDNVNVECKVCNEEVWSECCGMGSDGNCCAVVPECRDRETDEYPSSTFRTEIFKRYIIMIPSSKLLKRETARKMNEP